MSLSTDPSKVLSIFSLEGKNCLVTGGAGGLGQECLIAFALSGANCACVDLDLKACNSVLENVAAHILRETGNNAGKMRGYACNTIIEQDVKATVTRIVEDFGQIDVLVTCAGICINRSAESTDLGAWRKVMDVNLDGTFLFARHVGKHMLEQDISGSMILVCSAAASHPPRPQSQASYNASKAGVKLLGISLATEWANRGIRVNTLSPGFMKTPLMREQTGKESHEEPLTDLQKEWLTQIPMGRFADPSELRGTMVWMAGAASSYLTGADIVIDGGWLAW